jgi:hypothetical protein
MVKPISLGTAGTGLRMIREGIRWLWHSRQAPWSAINISANLVPHVGSWHNVRFWAINDKPFAIEIFSVRTIRPKNLSLRRADNSMNPTMRADTESNILDGLPWVMSEKDASTLPFQRHIFVNLDRLHGEVRVDFELFVRFLDNRRSELPVWVRTNPVTLP